MQPSLIPTVAGVLNSRSSVDDSLVITECTNRESVFRFIVFRKANVCTLTMLTLLVTLEGIAHLIRNR